MLKVESISNIGSGFNFNSNKDKGRRANIIHINDKCDIGNNLFEEVLNKEINRIKETVRNYEQTRK